MTDLTRIPGIGKNMAQHLARAGYPNVDSLKGQDPDEVYARLLCPRLPGRPLRPVLLSAGGALCRP